MTQKPTHLRLQAPTDSLVGEVLAALCSGAWRVLISCGHSLALTHTDRRSHSLRRRHGRPDQRAWHLGAVPPRQRHPDQGPRCLRLHGLMSGARPAERGSSGDTAAAGVNAAADGIYRSSCTAQTDRTAMQRCRHQCCGSRAPLKLQGLQHGDLRWRRLLPSPSATARPRACQPLHLAAHNSLAERECSSTTPRAYSVPAQHLGVAEG